MCNTPRMTLAQLVFKARQKTGKTQAAFAREIGVDQMTVSRWERGSQRPEDDRLIQIIKLVDLPADYFEQAA